MSTQEEDNRCGYRAFSLPKTHPFYPICALSHDPAYQNYLDGFPGRPLAEADKAMLNGFLDIAKEKDSLRLHMEAYVFYGLTTIFRWVFRSSI